MSGWNPPPAPGSPGYGYGAPGPAYAPPPPPRRSGAGLVIGLVLGGGLALVLVVVLVVVIIGATSKHEIDTPPVAGGMTRDYATEARISSQLNSQRSIIQRATNYKVKDVKSAVYKSGTQRYLFVGGTGDFDADDLYYEWRSAVSAEANSNVTTYTYRIYDAGGDGKAMCSTVRNRQSTVSTYSTAICAWSTDSSFGTVMPVPDGSTLSTSTDISYLTVASVMRRMRADIED